MSSDSRLVDAPDTTQHYETLVHTGPRLDLLWHPPQRSFWAVLKCLIMGHRWLLGIYGEGSIYEGPSMTKNGWICDRCEAIVIRPRIEGLPPKRLCS